MYETLVNKIAQKYGIEDSEKWLDILEGEADAIPEDFRNLFTTLQRKRYEKYTDDELIEGLKRKHISNIGYWADVLDGKEEPTADKIITLFEEIA